jgi:Flp pilus assembly protein TadD
MVLGADPRHARAWYLKGRALDRLGRFAEAVECFGKALEGGELP